MECENHNVEFVKQLNTAGNYFVKKQCLFCGETESAAVKFDKIGGKDKIKSLPDFDQEFYEHYLEIKRLKYYDEQKEKRKQDRLEWLETSKPYYNSEIWKIKREFVLKRDNYLCQACLTNKANQVHHLTYKHFGNEPLFELTSVCKQCHDKITLLDNE